MPCAGPCAPPVLGPREGVELCSHTRLCGAAGSRGVPPALHAGHGPHAGEVPRVRGTTTESCLSSECHDAEALKYRFIANPHADGAASLSSGLADELRGWSTAAAASAERKQAGAAAPGPAAGGAGDARKARGWPGHRCAAVRAGGAGRRTQSQAKAGSGLRRPRVSQSAEAPHHTPPRRSGRRPGAGGRHGGRRASRKGATRTHA